MRDILLPEIFGAQDDCPYYYEGPYEYGHALLKKGDTVIDAGANMGMFSALASRRGCSVLAFEPAGENLAHLRRTAALNSGISIFEYALSDKAGVMRLGMAEPGNPGSYSGFISQESSSAEVNVISLDEFADRHSLSKIDFIKADIEGAERNMLKGATGVLKSHAPRLAICTYHYPDDQEVLERLILGANPAYTVVHRWKKLYAWIPGRDAEA